MSSAIWFCKWLLNVFYYCKRTRYFNSSKKSPCMQSESSYQMGKSNDKRHQTNGQQLSYSWLFNILTIRTGNVSTFRPKSRKQYKATNGSSTYYLLFFPITWFCKKVTYNDTDPLATILKFVIYNKILDK